MSKIGRASVAIFLLAALPGLVHAINGSVTCTVASTVLTFNAYDPISGAADTLPTGTITVTCNSTSNGSTVLTYNLTLPPPAPGPSRVMTSGANNLNYDLYTDSGRTTVWNTANPLTCSYTLPKNGANQQNTCSFYGRISGGQDVPAGTYTQSGIAVGGTYSCNPVPSSGC
jgi:spore coat protein U domain-containing protein, fimbrial subunit CupE1/2/3/6